MRFQRRKRSTRRRLALRTFELKHVPTQIEVAWVYEGTEMTDCQHRWEPVEGQPIYKCARCNAFMRIVK